MSLKDKVIVITGSSAGIGKATALLFARAGAKIVVNCQKDKVDGDKVVDEIKKSGGTAICIQADVRDPKQVQKLFSETQKTFGTVDVLVNNAGLAKQRDPFNISEKELVEDFSLNMFSFVYCTQEAAKIMQKKGSGKIINISSICGLTGCSTVLPFSVARAGVNVYTNIMAKKLAPNIQVNAVAPGYAKTRFWDGMSTKDEGELLATTLTKKWVMPEDIADAVIYFATADSITGQVLAVDGGYTKTL